jgi:hypothetical protein
VRHKEGGIWRKEFTAAMSEKKRVPMRPVWTNRSPSPTEAVLDDERIYNTVIRSIVVLGLIAYTLISTSGGLDALRGLYASAMHESERLHVAGV